MHWVHKLGQVYQDKREARVILVTMVCRLSYLINFAHKFKYNFTSIGHEGPQGEGGDSGEYGTIGEKGSRVRI